MKVIKNPQVQKLFVGRREVQVRNLPQYADKIKILDEEVALGNLVKEEVAGGKFYRYKLPSNIGRKYLSDIRDDTHYCPNCGARMHFESSVLVCNHCGYSEC